MLTEVDRGLEEAPPVEVDGDVLWALEDWILNSRRRCRPKMSSSMCSWLPGRASGLVGQASGSPGWFPAAFWQPQHPGNA